MCSEEPYIQCFLSNGVGKSHYFSRVRQSVSSLDECTWMRHEEVCLLEEWSSTWPSPSAPNTMAVCFLSDQQKICLLLYLLLKGLQGYFLF